KIDGKYYSINNSSLNLTLMTEEGTEQLISMKRLRTLTVTPYKYAVSASVHTDNDSYRNAVDSEINSVFGQYTDVKDVSFLEGMTWLNTLSIRGCGCTDISCLRGMDSLTSLDIADTGVTDISVFGELPALEILDITGIPADDLSVLADISTLKKLTVGEDALDDELTKALSDNGVEILTPDNDNQGTTEKIPD
ncbi:MAG: hypothetical protein ACI4KF_10885, partial [Huintestinicola sp.]